MCGIVYVHRLDGTSANKRVWKKYNKQRERGYDGFGFLALDGAYVRTYERYMTEKAVEAAISHEKSDHILFHHRFPTSTENVPETAHPIRVSNRELKHTYYVVHNGVISNPEELYEKHIALGYKYTTGLEKQYITANGNVYLGGREYNDSETLAIELARTIEGLQMVVEAKGSIATMILQCDKTGKHAEALYYGTNGGNPLTIYRDERQINITSKGGKAIPDNIMYRYDLKNGTTGTVSVPLIPYTVNTQRIGYKTNNYDLYDHSYHIDEEKIESPYPSPYRDYTREEYEELIEQIRADIDIAKKAGELDEEQELLIELQEILQEYNLIMDYEEKKADGVFPHTNYL